MPVLLPAPLPGPAPLLPHTHLSTILRTAQLPPPRVLATTALAPSTLLLANVNTSHI